MLLITFPIHHVINKQTLITYLEFNKIFYMFSYFKQTEMDEWFAKLGVRDGMLINKHSIT